METEHRLERDEGWGGRGEEWARLEQLLELARSAHREGLSQERRDRIREGLFVKLEQRRVRRLRARALVIGASTALLAGLLLVFARRA